MAKKTDKAVDIELYFETTIRNIWCEASRTGQTHKWVMDQVEERVTKHPKWDKSPEWVKRSIGAYKRAWLDAAQAWRLDIGYPHEGTMYASHWSSLPEDLKDKCRQGNSCELVRSFWLAQPVRGVDVPESEAKEF